MQRTTSSTAREPFRAGAESLTPSSSFPSPTLSTPLSRQVLAFVSQVHHVDLPEDAIDLDTVTLDQVECNIVHCPDAAVAEQMVDALHAVRVKGAPLSWVESNIVRCPGAAVAERMVDAVEANIVRCPDAVIAERMIDAIDAVEANIVRCPDAAIAERMIDAIDAVRVKGDSCGGVVTCVARNVPRGLGSPVFDKLEAELARALMSLPATKGFEIGSGFSGMPCDALLKGLRLFSVCIPPRRCPCSMPSCHSLLSLPATKGFEIGSGF
ncbi:unnamed protein product [Closterium sp. NIES-65]|nr:unnamed protein product [Closterium sp. NIES-65]